MTEEIKKLGLEELKQRLKEEANKALRIDTIPEDMPISEKALQVEVNMKLYEILIGLLEEAEGQRSVKKFRFHDLK